LLRKRPEVPSCVPQRVRRDVCGVLWPPRSHRAIGSAYGGPSAAAERLPAVAVGEPELRLPPSGPRPTVLRPIPNTRSVSLLSYYVEIIEIIKQQLYDSRPYMLATYHEFLYNDCWPQRVDHKPILRHPTAFQVFRCVLRRFLRLLSVFGPYKCLSSYLVINSAFAFHSLL